MTTPIPMGIGSVPPRHVGVSGNKRPRFMRDMRFASVVALTAASSAHTTCAFSFTPTAPDSNSWRATALTPTSHPSPWIPASDYSRHNMPTSTALNAAKSTNAGAKPASVGQQIQQATDVNDLLTAASSLWVPTDDDLPPHYCQEVHHEKRQRWAGQLLGKMGQVIPASFDAASLWTDERLARAIEAAATPFEGRDVDRVEVEGRSVSETLIGLASVAGRAQPPYPFESSESGAIIASVAQLIARAEGMANEFELKDAVEVRWAARTLMARLPGLADQYFSQTPQLNTRVSHLPFDIFPLGVDWPSVCNGDFVDQPQLVSTLRDAIPFNFDTITTRTGSEVIERRGTAWVADEGIGALAYSGKLMKPQPLPAIVASAMRATEKIVLEDDNDEATAFFDCALCNHYPDAEAACKFHTDPEHGSLWDRLTCVVSAGDDRRFAFRPIPEMSSWGDWDTTDVREGNGNAPAVYHMFAGDVVKMSGRCNDDFWHAVYADDIAASRSSGEGRVSLVFKRAIDRNGKRGHGLSGEGRRSRRRQNQSAATMSEKTAPRPEMKRQRRGEKSGRGSGASSTRGGKKRSTGRSTGSGRGSGRRKP